MQKPHRFGLPVMLNVIEELPLRGNSSITTR